MIDAYVLKDQKTGKIYAIAWDWDRADLAAAGLPAGVIQADLKVEAHKFLEEGD